MSWVTNLALGRPARARREPLAPRAEAQQVALTRHQLPTGVDLLREAVDRATQFCGDTGTGSSWHESSKGLKGH